MDIRNIYCIGRNYADHARELGNAIPDKPILFSKPTHSLTIANGQMLEFPSNRGEIHHELEIVLHIGKPYEKGISLEELVDVMALGIDFTLRDEQNELKKKGHPWLRAKGFKHAAVVTDFWSFPGEETCKATDFSLLIHDQIVQKGNIQQMLFSFEQMVEEVGEAFGLGEGDLLFTGTPEGVGPIQSGDQLSLFWGTERKGHFSVRM
ncbi:fumarylacetoacetate hydrolase family protein [Halalkalibacterium halodurans]|jgi:2-keto-4-pentenoate hydratase/2-oxohepta-3-ene-1,7-dioic acid hydratase in catechol pathway|uniref:Fumarylacetoacetate hydrolase n=2 Tax=Halalkalibacterium halodurans TaxID=86665 RepID=A0A0M0KMJ3_ALKHA|nr:fumarylacetoacetate hydrolase family protein [Halalkalibacterium halodurans]MED3648069.1 fumarylacetoacetate hydrolase family protein [Halalkalibacterium halodurans]TPE70728.1 fumarylacetoacetate hydrolase family protein [Halalkalibacterium halodurans]